MTAVTKRAVLAGAGALAASSALAQTLAAAPPRVTIETPLGSIVVELAADKAPVTSANFLRYVDAGRFNGSVFYRAMTVLADPLTGLIQGGAKNDPAKAFSPIAHEGTKLTGLTHKDGTLSMARYAPGTATSEFFICLGDLSSLDEDPSQPGDNAGFAAFGHVVAGLDVVKAIVKAPVSPTTGETDGMKGQMLDPEVPILSVKRA
jgi:peptidyl-prolyl cis-trans isomerase A (cyclophilin A)